MTIPYLMNCPHDEDGWCLECTKRIGEENERLRDLNVVLLKALKESTAAIPERSPVRPIVLAAIAAAEKGVE